MENNEEDKNLQLLDVLGIPLSLKNNDTKNIIFSHKDKSLIYTLGSNIIRYNLKNDSKIFLQYFTSNILVLKQIQNENLNILIIISDNKPLPILSIWKIPTFQGIYSQELVIPNDLEFDKIYLEQINSNTLLILIINKNDYAHFLYVLNILNNTKFEVQFFGKIKGVLPKIIGFSCFYRTNDIAFIMKYNLQIYSIDLYKTNYTLIKNINFSFPLKENSLTTSMINNFSSILTEKGNCLIYDNNGMNNSTINPIGQELFIYSQFCDTSLCLSTSRGNIYVYNIYGFVLKYIIDNEDILNIKNFSLLNKSHNSGYLNIFNEDKIIIKASVDESIDQLFCLFQNNSFALLSINQLLDKTKFRYNIKSQKFNSRSFYSFNHSHKILDICLKNYNHLNSSDYNEICETKFYTCAQDNKLILYSIEQGTDKIKNLYYDLNHVLSLSKSTNNSSNYITSMKQHPISTHKLYAGDNKGFLYIISFNSESINKYKKYNIDSFGIIFLDFNSNGILLLIGLETGKLLIYKTNKSLECVIQLNDHFLSYDEIDFRKENNHIISYGYFFKSNRHRHCMLYFKNNNILEYDKLFKNENSTKIIKKKIMDIIFNYSILDIVIHPSENYVIVLDNKKQILINNINENKITAIIDLSSQMQKIYNIKIDISGLYLAVICDIKLQFDRKNIKNKNDLIIIEISSSKVKNFIIHNSSMSKAIFDNDGKYIIISGELGEISLWRLPGYISSNIKNFLCEIKNNEHFWDKYEIKYGRFLPYQNFNDDNITLTSFNSGLNNISNNFSSSNINNEEKIKESIEESNFSNTINFEEDKSRRKIGLTKSLTEKNKNIFRYNGKNNGIYNSNKIYNSKENGMERFKMNYKDNNDFTTSFNNLNINKKTIDNKRYNFWSKTDTMKIKNNINMSGYNKYPEPKDIDDYLLK